MRKIFSIMVVALIAVQTACAGEIVTRDEKQLPQQAREFIKEHFAEQQISYISIEDEFMRKKKYEVVLTNGTEIDFDSKGNWKEVDCKRNAIPQTLLLPGIKEYVNTNFSNSLITQIENDTRGYELELDNDLSIKFSKDGTFLRLED